MPAATTFDWPLISNPLPDRPDPQDPLLEKGAKIACRFTTIVAAIGLGSMAGIALPSFIAGVGLMVGSVYTVVISAKIIDLGKKATPETQFLFSLAAAVFFVATIILGVSSFIWLAATVNHIAAMVLTIGIGYFGGLGLSEGGKRAVDEFFKEKVDFIKIATGSGVAALALWIVKSLFCSIGYSPLMLVTTTSLALAVISDRALRQITSRQ